MLRAILCALVILPALLPAAHAAATQRCNTGYSSQIWLYGMSEQTQAQLAAVVAQPASDPGLFSRLWAPLRAQTSTSVLGNRSVVLFMDPFQDLPEMIAAMRADPVVGGHVESIEDNGGVCLATLPPPGFQTVTEYYNTVTGHYFLSGTADENSLLESGARGAGWQRTGESFRAIPPNYCYGSIPVFRFYGPGPNSHFYTVDPTECGGLRTWASGWIGEGVAFGGTTPVNGTCPSSIFTPYTPLYRLYNNRWMFNDSNHRYTVDPGIYSQMIARGWIGEGVMICIRNGR
jgi:hypothetical protein